MFRTVLRFFNKLETISIDRLGDKLEFSSRCTNQVASSLPGSSSVNRSKVAPNFMEVFPDIVRDLTEAGHMETPEINDWFAKVLMYNVPDGKNLRGLQVVSAYEILNNNPPSEDIRLAQIAGWCVEMLQAHILIADDIMDESITRRNKLCWHRTNNLGVNAVNDSSLIQNGIYFILRKYFRGKPYYANILELFHDVSMKTFLGQCLDLCCLDENNSPRIEIFNMDRYKAITKYKTTYYSFRLPTFLAMHMAGITDQQLFKRTGDICDEIAILAQVQDDYFDCFSDSDVTGKIGTDIQDGKCTWLVINALGKANEDQRKLIKDSYGQKLPEKVNAIKQLYEEFGLPELYLAYEEESYECICKIIKQMQPSSFHEVLLTYLEKIYRRKK